MQWIPAQLIFRLSQRLLRRKECASAFFTNMEAPSHHPTSTADTSDTTTRHLSSYQFPMEVDLKNAHGKGEVCGGRIKTQQR